MKLEIVSHCWRYSRLLTYQLSSLVRYPLGDLEVVVTVFLTEEDEATCRVVRHFLNTPLPRQLTLQPWELPKGKLLRRAVGRNLAALATDADWVWFADCDYVFGEGALAGLPSAVRHVDGPLAYPRFVLASRNPKLGDRSIERASGPPRELHVDPQEFSRRRLRRAIGGVQITRGDVVRHTGYCKESRVHRRTVKRWHRCHEDVLFRRILRTKGRPINLPNIYHIRHSRRGYNTLNVEL